MAVAPAVRFGLQVKAFKSLMDRDARLLVEKVSLEAFRAVVLRTPVDTGRLRASWNISSGTPDTSVEPPRGKSQKRAKTAQKRRRAPPLGPGELAKMTAFKHTRTFAKVFIVNNVSYARKINNGMPGGSRQAPDGITEPAIKTLKRSFGGRVEFSLG